MAKSQAQAAHDALLYDQGFGRFNVEQLQRYLRETHGATSFVNGVISFADGSTAVPYDLLEISDVGSGGDTEGQDRRTERERSFVRVALKDATPAKRERITLPNGKTAWMDT